MKAFLCSALLTAAIAAAAQAPDRDAQRVDERIRALQDEANRLAAQSRTLVGELQTLEVERQLRAAEAQQAEAERKRAEDALRAATDRLDALERQRQAQLPDLKAQLVDIYKRGRGGYAQLLFTGQDVREFARATRTVAALASLNARRIAEHRKTLEALRQERAALERNTRDLQAREGRARDARAAADRALAARTALAARIDSRRDLTAQYVGELQVAYDRLQQQMAAGRAGPGAEVPLAPFRGALEWPAAGRVAGRYGESANRLGGAAVRNGVEIAASEGSPVRAVHGGTVSFADIYSGFGTLVIVDHGGNNYSLYGYLDSATVARGDTVAGGTEVGTVGASPSGTPALYFEIRIDGRPVDPLQWLKAR